MQRASIFTVHCNSASLGGSAPKFSHIFSHENQIKNTLVLSPDSFLFVQNLSGKLPYICNRMMFQISICLYYSIWILIVDTVDFFA
jgi:hypothetical protein